MSSAFQIHENIYSSLLYDDNFEVSESQKKALLSNKHWL